MSYGIESMRHYSQHRDIKAKDSIETVQQKNSIEIYRIKNSIVILRQKPHHFFRREEMTKEGLPYERHSDIPANIS